MHFLVLVVLIGVLASAYSFSVSRSVRGMVSGITICFLDVLIGRSCCCFVGQPGVTHEAFPSFMMCHLDALTPCSSHTPTAPHKTHANITCFPFFSHSTTPTIEDGGSPSHFRTWVPRHAQRAPWRHPCEHHGEWCGQGQRHQCV
jgi:hypothetical protein